MSDWTPSPEQAQLAKTIAAGAFGSLVLVYLRHPGSLARVAFTVCIGVGNALIFTEMVADMLGSGLIPTAAIIGLIGKGAAEKLLQAFDKLDMSDWLKRKVEP